MNSYERDVGFGFGVLSLWGLDYVQHVLVIIGFENWTWLSFPLSQSAYCVVNQPVPKFLKIQRMNNTYRSSDDPTQAAQDSGTLPGWEQPLHLLDMHTVNSLSWDRLRGALTQAPNCRHFLASPWKCSTGGETRKQIGKQDCSIDGSDLHRDGPRLGSW